VFARDKNLFRAKRVREVRREVNLSASLSCTYVTYFMGKFTELVHFDHEGHGALFFFLTFWTKKWAAYAGLP
jgi:hypothetical protein